jgi:hypothetical protein
MVEPTRICKIVPPARGRRRCLAGAPAVGGLAMAVGLVARNSEREGD